MIRLIFISALATATPYNAAAQQRAVSELNLGSFSVTPDTGRNSPTIDVELVLVVNTGNVRHYRLDRRVIDKQGSMIADSADSRTCLSVLGQLAKVEELPMPNFVAPGSEQSQSVRIMLHPTSYTLKMRGHERTSNTDARVELTAYSGSPLALWVDETLEALEPCWNNTAS